ncbi:Immune-associated nucleotide-binding protein 12 [Bulinus truncatus]|nr:Immune-associated nucleotide-binding protein 12 [Bulinus truncatus]
MEINNGSTEVVHLREGSTLDIVCSHVQDSVIELRLIRPNMSLLINKTVCVHLKWTKANINADHAVMYQYKNNPAFDLQINGKFANISNCSFSNTVGKFDVEYSVNSTFEISNELGVESITYIRVQDINRGRNFVLQLTGTHEVNVTFFLSFCGKRDKNFVCAFRKEHEKDEDNSLMIENVLNTIIPISLIISLAGMLLGLAWRVRKQRTKCESQQNEEPLLDKNIDFLLVGKAGNGKSSTGNSILREKEFRISPNTTLETKKFQFGNCHFNERKLTVVDLPGIGVKDDMKLLMESIVCVFKNNSVGFNAFLLVLRYENRYTREEITVVESLKIIFGDNFLRKYGIIVFTYGDEFTSNGANEDTFELWCSKQQGDFKNLLTECNDRVILFNNITDNQSILDNQVRKLISIVDKMNTATKKYDRNKFKEIRNQRRLNGRMSNPNCCPC